MIQKIYADNAATTKLDEEALEAMLPYLQMQYGNASQPYLFASAAREALNAARKTIADCINADPSEIFFTSGGSESDNWAVKGAYFSNRKNIVTSSIEHHAILNSVQYLEKFGCSAKYLPVNTLGVVLPQTLCNNLDDADGIVSIMYANNEIGTIEPIKELAEIAHKQGCLFHTDAVQAVGHVVIDVCDLGVDMLSASAHKFNGPKGIGFLYKKTGVEIDNYIHGGAQEHGYRAGTENIAAIVGMATALKNNMKNIHVNQATLKELDNYLMQELSVSGLQYIRNGNPDNRLPGNISLSFNGADGEILLHRLDLKGISVSTGAACDSVNTQISHVLSAISLDREYAEGTIRISLGKENTFDDVKYIVAVLTNILKRQ